MAAGIAGPARRTFRRSLALRVTSLLALLLFGAAAAGRAASGAGGFGLAVTVTLALAALLGAGSAWGDRFTLDPGGIAYRNVFLGRLGARRIAWRDVLRVHAHHPARATRVSGAAGGGDAAAVDAVAPRALFIVPRQGRRLALDAIEDFDELRRWVTRACAEAGSEAGAGAAAGPEAGAGAGAGATAGTTAAAGVSIPPGDRPR